MKTVTTRVAMLATDCRVPRSEIRIDGRLMIVDLTPRGVRHGQTITPWPEIFAAAIDGDDDLSQVYVQLAREGVRRELVERPYVIAEWDGDQTAGSIWSELHVCGECLAKGPERRLGTVGTGDIVADSPLRKLADLFR